VALCLGGRTRTREDWARKIEWLIETQYSSAKNVVLVMDNLNTYSIAPLYQTFEPKHTLELVGRLEIHFTPKHSSWLNIAEIELSALGIQCIGSKRIPDFNMLNCLLEPWYVD